MRAQYEKSQIGKNEDGEKIVAYIPVREKMILEGEIDKPQTGKDEQEAESHDQTIVNPLFAKPHGSPNVPEKKAGPSLQ